MPEAPMPQKDDDVIVSFGDVTPWLMPKRLEKGVEQQVAATATHMPALTDQPSSPAADGHQDTPAGWD